MCTACSRSQGGLRFCAIGPGLWGKNCCLSGFFLTVILIGFDVLVTGFQSSQIPTLLCVFKFKTLHNQFLFPGAAFNILTASTTWFEPHRCWLGKQEVNEVFPLSNSSLEYHIISLITHFIICLSMSSFSL